MSHRPAQVVWHKSAVVLKLIGPARENRFGPPLDKMVLVMLIYKHRNNPKPKHTLISVTKLNLLLRSISAFARAPTPTPGETLRQREGRKEPLL